MAWSTGPTGVGEHSIGIQGFPRNVRDLSHPRHDPGWRYRVSNSRPDPSVRGGQERTSESSVVSLREGNGAQRDVRQGSDRSVVPKKRGNSSRGNPVEGRENVSGHEARCGRTVMEPLEGNMTDSLKFGTVYTQQRRIAKLARQTRDKAILSLNHYLDLPWLEEALRRTRKDGAVGVDGQTAAEYERDLEHHLQSLLNRAKSGMYFAPPVRRVHIPKGPGSTETRPLGIPTYEDKVLQRAVAMLLEPIYEQEFSPCSYGFRRGRSAHQALSALREGLMESQGGWILDVDIRKFFDTLQRPPLREMLRRRIRDGVVLRLIDKWLKAGVWEEGTLTHPDEGTPQGGVISPLLANIYLHHVLDEWFEQEVKPRLTGRAFLIRFADDFVMVFTHEADARRVLDVLPKRFAKFGLTLHPTKTRLVPFRSPACREVREGRRRNPLRSICWASPITGENLATATGS